MLDSKEAIERVLRALAERLDLAKTPAVGLAVCGAVGDDSRSFGGLQDGSQGLPEASRT